MVGFHLKANLLQNLQWFFFERDKIVIRITITTILSEPIIIINLYNLH